MKPHPLYLAIALFAVLVFAGNCRKSEISLESDNIGFSISGRVLDKDNFPVSQAQVKAGALFTVTDENGYFTLNNVRLPRDAAYVKVEKSGYFTGSRTFVANAQTQNYVSIRLIPKEITGTFTALGGGVVTLPAGGSISFQPNSIIDAATNNAYTGLVSVSAFFIDPTEPDFISIMPGDLRGITTSNQERGLQSFGMMAVELASASGQKLQLASGKPATMNFAIPAGLQSQAPSTIPLWYFDEATGLWKEEGSANKQGNQYVGTVSHFSFWNCDVPFPLVNFEAIVKDQNGNPVADAQVIIKKLSDSTMGCGRTDANGKVSGKIPANESLVIKIFNRCHNLLYTQNIGPYSGNANLGTITVTIQAPATVTISGSVVNCSSTAVTNGYVNVYLDGLNHKANITNGNFSISITRCNGNASQAHLFAEDVAANQQSATTSVTVTSGSVNAGQLNACGTTTDQFVNYTLDGNNYAFTSPPDSMFFYHVDSIGTVDNDLMASGGGNYLMLDYKGPAAPGVFPVGGLTIAHGNSKYEGQGFNVTISQFGNVGQFVTGSFSGTVTKSGTTTHTVTCTFKVRRMH